MKIVCINGAPMAGKDLFCEYCKQEIKGYVSVFSTVDCVKKIAKELGWNGQKTPEDRKFLSDLKDALTDWKDIPYNDVMKKIDEWRYTFGQFNLGTDNAVAFVHVREPKEIEKFVKRENAITLLLRREEAECLPTSNHADKDIMNYKYDFELWNNGSKEKLRRQARLFLEVIGLEVKEK